MNKLKKIKYPNTVKSERILNDMYRKVDEIVEWLNKHEEVYVYTTEDKAEPTSPFSAGGIIHTSIDPKDFHLESYEQGFNDCHEKECKQTISVCCSSEEDVNKTEDKECKHEWKFNSTVVTECIKCGKIDLPPDKNIAPNAKSDTKPADYEEMAGKIVGWLWDTHYIGYDTHNRLEYDKNFHRFISQLTNTKE